MSGPARALAEVEGQADPTALDAPGRRPAHRIAGRGLVVGATALPVVTAAAFALLIVVRSLDEASSPGLVTGRSSGQLIACSVAVGLGAAIAGALLVLGVELALRARLALRPLVLVLGGAGGALVVSWLVAWAYLAIAHGPRVGAQVFASDVLGWWLERPRAALVIVGFAGLLALGLGAARILPWPRATDGAGAWLRAARWAFAAAVGSLAGALAAAGGVEGSLEPGPYWQATGAFVVGPLALAVGLDLGEAIDDALVRLWRRRRAALGR